MNESNLPGFRKKVFTIIGLRIKRLRIENNLTLSDLANKSHVSKSYLSYIERGLQENPSIQVLEKIATVLHVDVNALLQEHIETANDSEIENEWIEFMNEATKLGITKSEIQELKDYIEFLKWRNEKDE